MHDALSESDHPLWSDLEVEQQLEQYLAESRDACVAAIKLIEERLEKVQEESAGLGLIIAHDHEVGTGLLRHEQEPLTLAAITEYKTRR